MQTRDRIPRFETISQQDIEAYLGLPPYESLTQDEIAENTRKSRKFDEKVNVFRKKVFKLLNYITFYVELIAYIVCGLYLFVGFKGVYITTGTFLQKKSITSAICMIFAWLFNFIINALIIFEDNLVELMDICDWVFIYSILLRK